MSDDGDVLSNLPRSRPGHRSAKRSAAAAGATPAPSAKKPARKPARRTRASQPRGARPAPPPPPRTTPLTEGVRLALRVADMGLKTATGILKRLPGA